MDAHQFVVDVDEAAFDESVVEASRRVPVLVDFWAEWCGPCRALAPVLARLAAEYDGRFVLAKVDTDANQRLAASLGIRGLPTVWLFKDGRVVDQLVGLHPEGTVREMLERHLEGPPDERREQAIALVRAGDLPGARRLLEQMLAADPDDHRLACDLALVLTESGELDAAEVRLSALPIDKAQEPVARRARAMLHLARLAHDAPSPEALARTLAQAPGDHAARLALGARKAQAGDYDGALEAFLEVLRRDRTFGEDAARRSMLAVFDLLDEGDPRVAEFRARMAAAMY